jgi:hypothetical protein
MRPTLTINLVVDPALDRDIYVCVRADGTSDVFSEDDLGDAEATTVDDDAVDAIYQRFENFDSSTPAREVGAKLAALGYTAHAPRHRAGSQTKSAYLRWIFKGTGRTVSLFMNTAAIVSDRDSDREFMKAQPGADVRGAKERVHFYFQDEDGPQEHLIDQAIAAAAALRDDASASAE